MSVLWAPWFWVGLAILAGVVATAWSAGHSPDPSPRTVFDREGRHAPETKHEHGEFADEPFLR